MMTFLERVFHLCSGLYCFLSFFFFQTTLSRSKCSITSHSVERIVDFEIQHSSTPGNISHPCDNTNDERCVEVDSVTTSAQCNLEKTEKRNITCGTFLRRSQTMVLSRDPGVRFSKDPKTSRARKAIRKTLTCLFCKAGLFRGCKGNKN